MNNLPDNEERLARLLERSLRNLPPRPAPRSLEARVLGELERRAALPWWRRGFTAWPMFVRGAFVALSASLVWLSILAGARTPQAMRSLDASAARPVSWAREAATFTQALGDLGSALSHAIPSAWLIGGLAVSGMLYAALFGLGIAGYRTFFSQTRILGDLR